MSDTMGFEWAVSAPDDCICSWVAKAGTDAGGHAMVGVERLSTTKDCPVHAPAQPFPTELCRAPECGKRIIWAVTSRLKDMPVLADPQPSGRVLLSWDHSGRKPVVAARMLTKAQAVPFGAKTYASHFADCPSADRFRTRR